MKAFLSGAFKIVKKDKNLKFLILQDNLKIIGITMTCLYILYLKDKILLNDVDMMILTGCSMAGVAIFAPILGKISDTHGCKSVLEFSYFIYIISYVLMFFAFSKWIVYLNYFLLGVAAASDLVTRDNIAIMLGKERNRSLYESLRSTFNLPLSIISPLLISFLIQYIGFDFVFALEIMVIMVAMYILNNNISFDSGEEQEELIEKQA